MPGLCGFRLAPAPHRLGLLEVSLTGRADSVGRARVEFALEKFLHRHPLVVQVELPAPGAQAQKLLEIVESGGQSSRHQHDRDSHSEK